MLSGTDSFLAGHNKYRSDTERPYYPYRSALLGQISQNASAQSQWPNKSVSPSIGSSRTDVYQVSTPQKIGVFPKSLEPGWTNADELLPPGVRKSWSCAFVLNLENTHGGRKAGSGGWAGLSN